MRFVIIRGLAAVLAVGMAGMAVPPIESPVVSRASSDTAAFASLVHSTPALAHAAASSTNAIAAPSNTLQTDWTRLAEYPSLVHSTVSAYAYDVTTHRILAQINPVTEVTPGSVTKLFTSAAALAALGPNFTYKTTVEESPALAAGRPGPIYLVGGGDPWLEANNRNDLEKLAAQVAAHVKKATRVVGISSLFAPPTYNIGWPIGGIPQAYSAGTSALLAERGEVSVWVQGAVAAGQPPRVFLKFNGAATAPGFFSIINRATTTVHGSGAITVTRVLGTNHLLVAGHVPASTYFGPTDVSVGNPALFAAALFQSALVKDGVSFSQSATTAPRISPGATVLASHASPPLRQELTFQNRFSINQMAENLYREISVSTHQHGSPQASAARMTAFTDRAGVDPGRVQVDGSGVSPLDQMSARQAVELLTYSAGQPWFLTLEHSLIQLNTPKACGFLCPPSWTVPLPAHTAIWVKSGSLTNQWNLAGYARSENGNLIAFAVLNDGTPTQHNMYPNSAVGQMVNLTASWPRVPLILPSAAPPETTGLMPAVVQNLVTAIPGQEPGSNVAVAVVNTANGQTVYQRQGQLLMRAGLSPRLALDMAALAHAPAVLNPAVVQQLGSVNNGTLTGSLILSGNNNNLSAADIYQMAHAIKNAGIFHVTGAIEYVSQTPGFQQQNWPGGMAWESLGQGWASPNADVWVHNDAVTLTVTGRATAGNPASLSLVPANAPIRLQNAVVTGPPGSLPSITATLHFHSNLFSISGRVPVGSSVTQTLTPPDPGALAAVELTDALANSGVSVNAAPHALYHDPQAPIVAQVPGLSVAGIVQQTLAETSLVPADELLRTLAPQAPQKVAAILDGSPISVNDWTGGSLGNYLTALGVADALARAYANPQQAPLVQELAGSVWKSQSPEQYEAAGYVAGPGHAVYAVVILASALAWSGTLNPVIVHP